MAGEKMVAVVDRVDETQGFGPGGSLRKMYRATFRVGEHGPFVVEIPAVEATPERVKAEIKKVVDLVTGVV